MKTLMPSAETISRINEMTHTDQHLDDTQTLIRIQALDDGQAGEDLIDKANTHVTQDDTHVIHSSHDLDDVHDLLRNLNRIETIANQRGSYFRTEQRGEKTYIKNIGKNDVLRLCFWIINFYDEQRAYLELNPYLVAFYEAVVEIEAMIYYLKNRMGQVMLTYLEGIPLHTTFWVKNGTIL